MSLAVHPGDLVWMAQCDHGFPKPNTIVQLKVVSVGRKYFCCAPSTRSGETFEFNLNDGREHNKIYTSTRRVYTSKDSIYDLCDTYSCLKAMQLASWTNFNGAMLAQLDAAAQILGVEYEKVDRGLNHFIERGKDGAKSAKL